MYINIYSLRARQWIRCAKVVLYLDAEQRVSIRFDDLIGVDCRTKFPAFESLIRFCTAARTAPPVNSHGIMVISTDKTYKALANLLSDPEAFEDLGPLPTTGFESLESTNPTTVRSGIYKLLRSIKKGRFWGSKNAKDEEGDDMLTGVEAELDRLDPIKLQDLVDKIVRDNKLQSKLATATPQSGAEDSSDEQANLEASSSESIVHANGSQGPSQPRVTITPSMLDNLVPVIGGSDSNRDEPSINTSSPAVPGEQDLLWAMENGARRRLDFDPSTMSGRRALRERRAQRLRREERVQRDTAAAQKEMAETQKKTVAVKEQKEKEKAVTATKEEEKKALAAAEAKEEEEKSAVFLEMCQSAYKKLGFDPSTVEGRKILEEKGAQRLQAEAAIEMIMSMAEAEVDAEEEEEKKKAAAAAASQGKNEKKVRFNLGAIDYERVGNEPVGADRKPGDIWALKESGNGTD